MRRAYPRPVRVPMKRRRRVRAIVAYLAKCSEDELERVLAVARLGATHPGVPSVSRRHVSRRRPLNL